MTPKTIMVVAGDPSGDANAAELVKALAKAIPSAQFIGAGGPKMAEAGVQLSFNLTDDAAIGPVDVVKKLGTFWKRRQQLLKLAKERKPELIILVDFYTFNQQLARVIKLAHLVERSLLAHLGRTSNWQLKIVQYTSPQVWASRPGRAEKMAKNIDLLLCFFPFEKDWYAKRGTSLRVEFVGHPMFDRHADVENRQEEKPPIIVLLPGSRAAELKRHLPVMLAAARQISASQPVRFKLVAASEKMADDMRTLQMTGMPKVEIQTGQLAEALSTATLAIASTGTVTMECAYFGVPTVALYKTSTLFYLLARQFVTVKYLAMPNLLADKPLFPEFIQGRATAENLAKAALELLADEPRRTAIRAELRRVIESLGGPGSTQRAAASILQLIS